MVEATKVTLDVNTRVRWAEVGVGAGAGAFGTSGAEVETGTSPHS